MAMTETARLSYTWMAVSKMVDGLIIIARFNRDGDIYHFSNFLRSP